MEMYIAKFEKEDNKTVLYVPVYANTEMEAKNKAHYVLFQAFDDALKGREDGEDWAAYNFISLDKQGN